MATPRMTAEGVKVQYLDEKYYCGNCLKAFDYSYGFMSRKCPSCGVFNRGDFSPDLASERIERLANRLDEQSRKHDSMAMMEASAALFHILEEVKHLEAISRTMFGGEEPLPDPLMHRGLA